MTSVVVPEIQYRCLYGYTATAEISQLSQTSWMFARSFSSGLGRAVPTCTIRVDGEAATRHVDAEAQYNESVGRHLFDPTLKVTVPGALHRTTDILINGSRDALLTSVGGSGILRLRSRLRPATAYS